MSTDHDVVDLSKLNEIERQAHQSFLNQFRGIRVVIDFRLSGNAFYCCVSQAVYNELQKEADSEKAED